MSIYNEDELVAPQWVNREFCEKVLQQYDNNKDIKVTHIDISPATMKGDHYASVMFRCKVSYNCHNFPNIKQKSLILKTLPAEDGPKRDMLKESNLFETEIEMYTKALPKVEKILTECGEPSKLAATIIYYSLEPHKVLIFEDLCEAGYNTIRGRYLNEDEIKMVYCKLAKLHAASYVLAHTDERECVTKFEEGLFCSSTIMNMGFMTEGIINFMDMLSNDEHLRVYLEKVKIMQSDIMKQCKNLYQAYKLNKTLGDIFVLNHGDFHMKNMMFKFNSENQMVDLIMNEFMHYYFEEFIRILNKIHFVGKLPNYSDFQIAGLKYRHFALFLLSTFLPHVNMIMVSSADELKDIDTAKYIENSEMSAKAYQRQEFIDEMRCYLPSLLMDGYLD